jgi:hypothetical protein
MVQMARERGLAMKVIDVELTAGTRRMTVYFNAEDRVVYRVDGQLAWLVQRPHHRLLRTRAEPGASGRFAYRGHRVEWPAFDNPISVSESAHAASDITTSVNPTMLLLIRRCGAYPP